MQKALKTHKHLTIRFVAVDELLFYWRTLFLNVIIIIIIMNNNHSLVKDWLSMSYSGDLKKLRSLIKLDLDANECKAVYESVTELKDQ